MTVRVVAFARAREVLAGRDSIEVDQGVRISDAWELLLAQMPALRDVPGVRFAVGGAIAEPSHTLREGDELFILPAVGGG